MADTVSGTPTPTPPRIEDLTPENIRKICAGYGIAVTGEVGTMPSDLWVFGAYNLVLVVVSFILVLIVTAILGIGDGGVTFWWTLGLWALALGGSYKLWFVSTPKLTALMTLDNLTKKLHPRGPGWGIKKMWVTYDPEEDYIDLTSDQVSSTRKFQTADGIPVDFDWSQEFAPFLPLLPLYIRMENKVLEQGLDSIVESVVSHNMLGKTLKKIQTPGVIDDVRKNINLALQGVAVDGAPVLDAQGNSMEIRFGFKAELPTISPPTPDKDIREMLIANVKGVQFHKLAQKIAKPDPATGWPGMAADRAMRQVMIMNNEPGVTDQSFTLDLSDNAKAAAPDLARIAQAIGPAGVQAIVAGGRSGGGNKGGGGSKGGGHGKEGDHH